MFNVLPLASYVADDLPRRKIRTKLSQRTNTTHCTRTTHVACTLSHTLRAHVAPTLHPTPCTPCLLLPLRTHRTHAAKGRGRGCREGRPSRALTSPPWETILRGVRNLSIARIQDACAGSGLDTYDAYITTEVYILSKRRNSSINTIC